MCLELVKWARALGRAVLAGNAARVQFVVQACLGPGAGQVKQRKRSNEKEEGKPRRKRTQVGAAGDARAVAEHYGAPGTQSAAARLEGALRAFAAVCTSPRRRSDGSRTEEEKEEG